MMAHAVGQLRGAASPGPNGWRNTHIVLMTRTLEGMDLAAALIYILVSGELSGRAAELWNAEILEPVD